MARIVLWQLMVALAAAAIAALAGGTNAAASSLLGGLSCVIPNAIFVIGILVSESKQKPATLGVLYAWELVKVALTIVLMVAAFWLYRDLNWVAFLSSFVVVLKSYVFLLSRLKNS